MDGLMQEVPLTLDLVLRRMESVAREVTVTSVLAEGPVRHTWGEIAARARRLAAALDRLEVPVGARVATLAWNSHRHLELFYAVPCSARVLHPLNARLQVEELLYIVAHGHDDVLFIDASLTPLLEPVAERLSLRRVVVMDDGSVPSPAFAAAPHYEQLIEAERPLLELPALEESAAVCICHTSGTSGRPKAVAYSNRSVVLHALGVLSPDGHGVNRAEVVLPLTPMFHLMAWGLPYSTALAAAPLVLAGADTSPAAIASLIESERVTMAAGVPTFWVRLAEELGGERDLSSLRRVLCGGSGASRSLVERYLDAGIEFASSWGMTEAGSGTCGRLLDRAELDTQASTVRQGPPIPGVELRIVDPDGRELAWDDVAIGELEARGPWIARAYLDPEDDSNTSAFHDGWLRTGDLACIDATGSVRIVDRAKDLVKSGGEWISSAELEARLLALPGVAEAAVIAVADELWGERPLAVLVADAGASIGLESVRVGLAEEVPSWWVPDRIELVAEMPKTSVGKLDKARLRETYGRPAQPA